MDEAEAHHRRRSEDAMPHYRLYILDERGRIARGIDLDCRDDDHARELGAEHRKSHAIEIWQGERFVGSFPKEK